MADSISPSINLPPASIPQTVNRLSTQSVDEVKVSNVEKEDRFAAFNLVGTLTDIIDGTIGGAIDGIANALIGLYNVAKTNTDAQLEPKAAFAAAAGFFGPPFACFKAIGEPGGY